MLGKLTFLYFCAVFAVTNCDLVDEALEQVDQLKSIVQGEIFTALDNLNSLLLAFETNSANVANSATEAVKQEEAKIIAQLIHIIQIAYVNGKNPSQCFSGREELVNKLSTRLNEEMITCLAAFFDEARQLTEKSKYIVDISYNIANHFEYQIKQCRGELLCISPILSKVEINKIKLPQSIKTEVQSCENLVTTLKLSTQSCSDAKISEFVGEAIKILLDVQRCVDDL